jgi:hypothetical protein
LKQCFPKDNLSCKKGNSSEFFAYSKKDGDYTDQGELSHNNQGDRADFDELIEVVNDSLDALMLN